MGDRANVEIKDGDSSVFLYTHWNGFELPGLVQAVMKRQQRWDDPQYLARIVFSAMIKDNITGETGYGITARVHDGSDRVITLDVDKQLVSWSTKKAPITFEDFIKQPVVSW